MQVDILSCVIASTITLLVLYFLAPYAAKFNLLLQPTLHRHSHKTCAAVIGGIGIYSALMLTSLFWFWLGLDINFYFLIGVNLLFLIGVMDDARHVPPSVRLFVQILAATILVSGGNVQIDSLGFIFTEQELLLNDWAKPFTIFALVGAINAFNMVDGINGLAGNLTLIPLITISFLSLELAPNFLNLSSLVIMLSVFIFLLFNFSFFGKQRKVFLGDAGSTVLGFMVGWQVIEAANPTTGTSPLLTPMAALLLIAIPVIDAIAVMVRRSLRGLSPFLADKKHLHHIVMLMGKGPMFTLAVISAVGLFLALIAIYQSKLGLTDSHLFILFLSLFVVHQFLLKAASLKRK